MNTKKISVQLDSTATKSLNRLMQLNCCTISDIVNAALVAFAQDTQPVLPSKELHPILATIIKSKWGTIDNWCESRSIKKHTLYYLVKSISQGHSVCGFGNTKNKYRDKNDERIFKTHTAWIAHCLHEDFSLDIEDFIV